MSQLLTFQQLDSMNSIQEKKIVLPKRKKNTNKKQCEIFYKILTRIKDSLAQTTPEISNRQILPPK